MKPFMTYMGGKRKMLRNLRPNLPQSFQNYHEPFLGGGALALDIMVRCIEQGDTQHTFYLSDYSMDVVSAWLAVKDYPEELEETLKSLFVHHSREQFNSIRDWDKEGLLDSAGVLQRGARFIYLMSTCFGGIVTSDKDGFLSVSYSDHAGKTQKYSGYDFKNMHAVSKLLNTLDAHIFQASYEVVLDKVGYGDFIYLDPPYETTSDDGRTLTSDYVSEGIEHSAVKQVILDCTSAGSYVLLSNSNTAVTRALYENWGCNRPRHFWAGNNGATQASELLVANWRLADDIHRQQVLAA